MAEEVNKIWKNKRKKKEEQKVELKRFHAELQKTLSISTEPTYEEKKLHLSLTSD